MRFFKQKDHSKRGRSASSAENISFRQSVDSAADMDGFQNKNRKIPFESVLHSDASQASLAESVEDIELDKLSVDIDASNEFSAKENKKKKGHSASRLGNKLKLPMKLGLGSRKRDVSSKSLEGDLPSQQSNVSLQEQNSMDGGTQHLLQRIEELESYLEAKTFTIEQLQRARADDSRLYRDRIAKLKQDYAQASGTNSNVNQRQSEEKDAPSDHEKRVQDLELQYSQIVKLHSEERDAFEKRIEQLKSKNVEYLAKVAEVENAQCELDALLDKEKIYTSKIDELQTKIHQLEYTKSQREDEIDKLKSLESIAAQYETLQQEYHLLQEQKENAIKKSEISKEQMKLLTEGLNSSKEEATRVSASNSELLQAAEKMRNEMDSLKSLNEELRKLKMNAEMQVKKSTLTMEGICEKNEVQYNLLQQECVGLTEQQEKLQETIETLKEQCHNLQKEKHVLIVEKDEFKKLTETLQQSLASIHSEEDQNADDTDDVRKHVVELETANTENVIALKTLQIEYTALEEEYKVTQETLKARIEDSVCVNKAHEQSVKKMMDELYQCRDVLCESQEANTTLELQLKKVQQEYEVDKKLLEQEQSSLLQRTAEIESIQQAKQSVMEELDKTKTELERIQKEHEANTNVLTNVQQQNRRLDSELERLQQKDTKESSKKMSVDTELEEEYSKFKEEVNAKINRQMLYVQQLTEAKQQLHRENVVLSEELSDQKLHATALDKQISSLHVTIQQLNATRDTLQSKLKAQEEECQQFQHKIKRLEEEFEANENAVKLELFDAKDSIAKLRKASTSDAEKEERLLALEASLKSREQMCEKHERRLKEETEQLKSDNLTLIEDQKKLKEDSAELDTQRRNLASLKQSIDHEKSAVTKERHKKTTVDSKKVATPVDTTSVTENETESISEMSKNDAATKVPKTRPISLKKVTSMSKQSTSDSKGNLEEDMKAVPVKKSKATLINKSGKVLKDVTSKNNLLKSSVMKSKVVKPATLKAKSVPMEITPCIAIQHPSEVASVEKGSIILLKSKLRILEGQLDEYKNKYNQVQQRYVTEKEAFREDMERLTKAIARHKQTSPPESSKDEENLGTKTPWEGSVVNNCLVIVKGAPDSVSVSSDKRFSRFKQADIVFLLKSRLLQCLLETVSSGEPNLPAKLWGVDISKKSSSIGMDQESIEGQILLRLKSLWTLSEDLRDALCRIDSTFTARVKHSAVPHGAWEDMLSLIRGSKDPLEERNRELTAMCKKYSHSLKEAQTLASIKQVALNETISKLQRKLRMISSPTAVFQDDTLKFNRSLESANEILDEESDESSSCNIPLTDYDRSSYDSILNIHCRDSDSRQSPAGLRVSNIRTLKQKHGTPVKGIKPNAREVPSVLPLPEYSGVDTLIEDASPASSTSVLVRRYGVGRTPTTIHENDTRHTLGSLSEAYYREHGHYSKEGISEVANFKQGSSCKNSRIEFKESVSPMVITTASLHPKVYAPPGSIIYSSRAPSERAFSDIGHVDSATSSQPQTFRRSSPVYMDPRSTPGSFTCKATCPTGFSEAKEAYCPTTSYSNVSRSPISYYSATAHDVNNYGNSTYDPNLMYLSGPSASPSAIPSYCANQCRVPYNYSSVYPSQYDKFLTVPSSTMIQHLNLRDNIRNPVASTSMMYHMNP